MQNTGTQPAPRAATTSAPDERSAALAFLEQLATEVSRGTVDLPCFPNVVVRVCTALANPDTNADKIVSIVGTEPRLAARLLQIANSAAFNSAGKTVSELRSAITRVGQNNVQSITMAFAMKSMQRDEALKTIAKPLEQLWDRSIAVASICQLVAERTKVHTDQAFLAGLLHGIGTLYIMARVATKTANPVAQRACMDLLAGWQAAIGKAVLENWKFADEMCEAVADQQDTERRWRHDATLTDVLIVAVVLADVLSLPEPRSVSMEGISSFASIGLTPTDCEATLVRAERRIAVMRAALT